jgi:purine-binding chemotaxis protein CheW
MKRAGERKRTDPRKNLVGFMIGTTQYAIDIWRVREIVKPMPTTSVPHSPPALAGMADHRGEVVPILDLRIQFGVPAESARKTKCILLNLPDTTMGIVVDAVVGVFGSDDGQIRQAPSIGTGAERAIVGVASNQGQMVFVLDPTMFAELARPALPQTPIHEPGRGPLLSARVGPSHDPEGR